MRRRDYIAQQLVDDGDLDGGSNEFYQGFINLFTDIVSSDCVISGLAASAGGGMNISVAIGTAYFQGKRMNISAPATVTLAAADPTNPRIDCIYVKTTLTSSSSGGDSFLEDVASVDKVTGTPTVSPVAPAVTGGTKLAEVYVTAGAVSITSGNITDSRFTLRGLYELANHLKASAANVHAHSQLSGVTADQHHPQAHTLTSHTTRAHSELTGIGTDDHHAQTHTHASHTGIGADDHHAQTHTHASHIGIGANDHHAQLHAASHVSGGGDALSGTLAVNITGNANTVDGQHGPASGYIMGATGGNQHIEKFCANIGPLDNGITKTVAFTFINAFFANVVAVESVGVVGGGSRLDHYLTAKSVTGATVAMLNFSGGVIIDPLWVELIAVGDD